MANIGTNSDMRISTRLNSLDILRGAVMVLMAIDHVRVYSGIPAGGQSVGVFFTRWVTNFCAPVFVFLAGTSAFLYGIKITDKAKLSRYLVSRGLLLVFLELTLIRFCWMFNFDYKNIILAGVIWMLGCCMILLAAFVRFRPITVGIIGLLIISLQHVFHFIPRILPEGSKKVVGWIWEFIYPADLDPVPGFAVLYVIVPWIGVMMAGYGFGQIMLMDAARRKRICLRIGIAAILLFLLIGTGMILFRPAPENPRPFIFRLLNQQKYPASPTFLLMTLGPLIALVPWAEKLKGWFANLMQVFGRVPMFYYILHILLIHASAIIANLILKGATHQEWYTTAPFTNVPEDQRWPLYQLYGVFFIDVFLLYFACRWYGKYKAAHPGIGWLKYL